MYFILRNIKIIQAEANVTLTKVKSKPRLNHCRMARCQRNGCIITFILGDYEQIVRLFKTIILTELELL